MKKILNLIVIFCVMAMGFSCKKFLDVNVDPNAAKTPEINKLLTNAQYYAVIGFSHHDNYIGTEMATFVHHTNVRETPNAYGTPPEQNGFMNSWNALYAECLTQFDLIERTAKEQKNYHFAGIAQVMKAYILMNMVDLWGDIPYREALGSPVLLYPKADKGEDIYNACFDLLKSAKANLATGTAGGENYFLPGTADLFYGGNTGKWTALANSIMFRMLNNTKAVKSVIEDWTALLAEAVAGPRITPANEFEFKFTTTQSPSDERYPGFLSCYGITQHTNYPSPWLYEIMQGYTQYNYPDNPLADITDPRIPYYFFNQTLEDGSVVNPTSYRDGGFISLFFGDISSASGGNVTSNATLWGIYPAGGIYDNGNGGTGYATSTTRGAQGATVQKLYTYTDMKFNEVEMILAGEMTGDARSAFSDAMDAAFAHLNKVCNGKPGVPTGAISSSAREAYRDAVLVKYDAATASEKLHLVMLQKWLHDVFNSVEAYTSYRRTGYPKIFDADSPGYGINPAGMGTINEKRNTYCNRPYPYSLWYPRVEIDRNANLKQKPDQRVKVFWQTVNL